MTPFKRRLILPCLLLLGVAAFFSIWQAIAPRFKYTPPTTHVASPFKPSTPLKQFTLTDTNGNPFTAKSLRGHWTLLFFGYTRCPDICPRTLSIVKETWQQFSQTATTPAKFIFADISNQAISHDELKVFLNNYHPDFLGLTGSQLDMHKLSDQLGIYSKMQQDSIDHTSAMMLIDPQARLCAIFTPPFSAQDLIHDLQVLTSHN